MIDCIVKLLDYEAQEFFKKKRVLQCDKCLVKENCEKWMKVRNSYE